MNPDLDRTIFAEAYKHQEMISWRTDRLAETCRSPDNTKEHKSIELLRTELFSKGPAFNQLTHALTVELLELWASSILEKMRDVKGVPPPRGNDAAFEYTPS